MVRLITLPISHYCEKARWALDRAGVAYREERHIQVLHSVAARRAGGGRTVPVLVADGEVVADSAKIIAWADERLPQDQRLLPSEPSVRTDVLRVSAHLDGELGPAARRLVYVRMLPQRELLIDSNDQGVPAWEDRFMRAGYPLITGAVKRVLGIRPGVEVGDESTVFEILDRVGVMLSDGREYLCGERFSGADLTFAALMGPLVAPAEYAVRLPADDEVDAATFDLVTRARAHPAGAFAVRMYSRERLRTVA